MREETVNFEKPLKNCSGLKEIRVLADKRPELRGELLESVCPARELMYETLKRIPMKSGEIHCLDPALDEEFEEINLVLQTIEEDFDVHEMMRKKKVILQDYANLYRAISDHCVLGHYMFSFLKCNEATSVMPQICQSKNLDLAKFSNLHHLPFPMPMELNKEKFRHFTDLFGKTTV